MPHDSITTLRADFPALALVTSVMPPRDRTYLADLLLLWLEVNRARNAAESMIAAARITWWREALDNKKSEGVPLAERLLAHHLAADRDIAPITSMLEHIVGITLNAADSADHQTCHAMGDMLAATLHNGNGGGDIAHALLALRGAMGGITLDDGLAATLFAADMPTPFKLMAWLAQDPTRLNYPDAHPLLPLKLMVKAFRL